MTYTWYKKWSPCLTHTPGNLQVCILIRCVFSENPVLTNAVVLSHNLCTKKKTRLIKLKKKCREDFVVFYTVVLHFEYWCWRQNKGFISLHQYTHSSSVHSSKWYSEEWVRATVVQCQYSSTSWLPIYICTKVEECAECSTKHYTAP